ncbi:hypothetical protein FDC58_09795 [Clostridium botulinum]|uniref:rolling circle replication-associated protein n=1 Tax=unclassified Clostridium TaxID=2614128 RepID=UPI0013C9D1C8|nr:MULTISPECIES: hypothetical protein [unclassified Clostridium]MBY7008483.1 hypothetical protein [Clostridium botulinum]NFH73119.1 hypothetical protein [Clostridium botulinum]NFI81896.1 hypothetical protein [Clostridium botulinum]NFJ72301.1 hypothetical protein [Clostridium botulinum]NFK65406.1 hypothetical protein [Clostridium botulinum]
MPYIKSTIVAGKTIEVKKYYSSRYKATGIVRSKRIGVTTEEQEEINRKHAEEKLRWRLNANYKEGDYHLVLDYILKNRPDGRKEMREDIDEFLKLLRKEFKKLNKELKYIHVMEIGKKGAKHHHLVINNIDTKIIQRCWNKGRIKVFPLDSTGQYGELAAYLIKQTAKSKELQSKKWNSSRNLIIPEPKKEIINANKYIKNPKPKKGYYIDKNSIVSGISQYDGYPFLKYTLIKIDERRRRIKKE